MVHNYYNPKPYSDRTDFFLFLYGSDIFKHHPKKYRIGYHIGRIANVDRKYLYNELKDNTNENLFYTYRDCNEKLLNTPKYLKDNNYNGKIFNLDRIGQNRYGQSENWYHKNFLEQTIHSEIEILYESFTSEKLFEMLNLEKQNWSRAGSIELIAVGHKINKAELLFSKIEDEFVAAQVEKLNASKVEPVAAIEEQKAETSFDDFSKMDIRIGTILEAERVPKTDKLLKLKIDTGIDQRTVVSGIAGSYKPEEIIGQQVSILVNLAPRKIKGIESQGMILMAENNKGELAFLMPDKNVNNGGKVS
jgi:methionyl-tRNA synthetase